MPARPRADHRSAASRATGQARTVRRRSEEKRQLLLGGARVGRGSRPEQTVKEALGSAIPSVGRFC
ncbi:hypothetical protein XF30_13660 [Bradyrhizobium sp. SUTN9-2]|nr:hypothetical protein XF30_13660 [Bradyrhizobium sp. SUTN9-2]